MHLQEKTLFELDVWIKFTHTAAHYLPHHVTYANLKFVVTTSNSLAGYAFTRKTLFDLDFWAKVTQNVIWNFLNHVTYAHAKVEVVASKFRR